MGIRKPDTTAAKDALDKLEEEASFFCGLSSEECEGEDKDTASSNGNSLWARYLGRLRGLKK